MSALPAFVGPAAPDVPDPGRDTAEASDEPRPARAGQGSVLTDRSADDSDLGWGDRGADSNDDRLRQDKPPHW